MQFPSCTSLPLDWLDQRTLVHENPWKQNTKSVPTVFQSDHNIFSDTIRFLGCGQTPLPKFSYLKLLPNILIQNY